MNVSHCDNWLDFEKKIASYAQQHLSIRDGQVFRGVGNSNWNLDTTLDRFIQKNNLEHDRKSIENLLRNLFAEQCMLTTAKLNSENSRDEYLQLFARHHGLPSPILDWSKSPFVAAFFAFSDTILESETPPKNVGIYLFDRRKAFEQEEDLVKLAISEYMEEIDDFKLLADNSRALEQRSIFYRINHGDVNLIDVLEGYIFQFTIPSSERLIALAKLDEMGYNQCTLFRSPDSAAETASYKLKETLRG